MKICIDGFRNIEHLEYEMVDNKHNFLFGLSGSGKSSISDSINCPVPSVLDKTFGREISQSVSIDNKDCADFKIKTFNGDLKNHYFSDERNKILRVFLLDETTDFKKCQKSFSTLIQSFINRIDLYSSTYEELMGLLRNSKSDRLTKDGTLRADAVTNKIIAELKRTKNGPAMKKLLEIDSSLYSWYRGGVELFDKKGDKRCPFCGKIVRSKSALDKIDAFRTFDPKVVGSYKATQQSLKKYFSRRIKEEISAIEKVSDALVSINNAVSQFKGFKEFLEKLKEIEFFDGAIEEFKLDKKLDVEKYFKGLNRIVEDVNLHIGRINRQYISAKKKTDEALKKKTEIINSNLAILDVPYV